MLFSDWAVLYSTIASKKMRIKFSDYANQAKNANKKSSQTDSMRINAARLVLGVDKTSWAEVCFAEGPEKMAP